MEKIETTHKFYCDKCGELILEFTSVNEEGYQQHKLKHFMEDYCDFNGIRYWSMLCDKCHRKAQKLYDRAESDENIMRILMNYKFQKDLSNKN